MNLEYLQSKRICILGLGIENYALVNYLTRKKVKCEITVCDARKDVRRSMEGRTSMPLKWRLGKNYDKSLTDFDIIFRSPGYPLYNTNLVKAKKKGVEISSPMKLFFELCPTKNIIGVTGTKGKGTTVALIRQVLKKAGKRTWLGGNIGIAPFEFIDKIKKNDWVILELSSFQLEDMTVSPHIAVITNFSREHLAPADPNNPNYHKTIRDYWDAKLNIIKWQKKGDKAIIGQKLKVKKLKVKSKLIYFSRSSLPTKLIGEHNKENIAAAVEVAKIVGVQQSIIKKAVTSFKGLEHRLELVRNIKGVKYYNDSFATTPESAITALRAFNQPIILLAGGAEKKSDFRVLVKEIKKRVKLVVLLNGKATPRLKKELLKINFSNKQTKLVYNINEAIRAAKQNSNKGDIILLSTACASFGMFKNYKERGELFKQEVKILK